MGRKLQPKQVKGQDGGHEVNVWQSQTEKEAFTLGRWWSHHWKKPIFSTKTKLMKNREIFIRIQVFLGLAHIIMEAEKFHFRLSRDPGTLLVSLLWAQRPGTEESWCLRWEKSGLFTQADTYFIHSTWFSSLSIFSPHPFLIFPLPSPFLALSLFLFLHYFLSFPKVSF